jgi:hypothetical protein
LASDSRAGTLVKTLLVVLGLLAIAVPSHASGITYEYISDASLDGPNTGPTGSTGTLTYTLVIDGVTGDATFTIDGAITADEVWSIGWFSFKFSEGNISLALSDLDWDPDDTSGPWSIATSSTAVPIGGTTHNLTNGGRSAIYVDSLLDGSPEIPLDGGICLTATFCSVDTPVIFTFTVALPNRWSEEEIEFKAGYYDGLSGKKKNPKFITGQLSKELLETVPDGGTTLSLLGGALLGLGLLRRKFRTRL